jgi:peptidoglycan/xylan/chitin deacetylase (PgdA/CDA1 family)
MRAILTYHSIDPSGSPISIDRQGFARHVRFLASGKVEVLGITELLSSPDDAAAVALTFDDGFENFATEAWPLLREHGLPATLFVVSDRVGQTNAWPGDERSDLPTLPLCDWEALGRMVEQGLVVGVHGRRHVPLVGRSTSELQDEILGAKEKVEGELGLTSSSFCYPYGSFDEAAYGVVSGAFADACTTELRTLSSSDDAYRLPRLDAYYLRETGRLESWGSLRLRLYLGARRLARRVRRQGRRGGKERPAASPAQAEYDEDPGP